jgi:hypothetical protein
MTMTQATSQNWKEKYIYILITTITSHFYGYWAYVNKHPYWIFFQSSKLEISDITNFQSHEILIKLMCKNYKILYLCKIHELQNVKMTWLYKNGFYLFMMFWCEVHMIYILTKYVTFVY